MSESAYAYQALEASLEQGNLVIKRSEKSISFPADNSSVLIEVHYSSLNYKDALGVTGKGKIFKALPITPGIDAAGVVKRSNHIDYKVGDKVLVTGCGIGESADGGYAELLLTKAEHVIKLPDGLSPLEAMIYGTAGFTAGLCIERLEANDQTPEKGPMLVTGASGGVGSFAVAMLSALGFEVVAMSGKGQAQEYLMQLGATNVINPNDFDPGSKPLEKAIYGGGVDNTGGHFLEGMIRQTALWGNIASVGLASDYRFSSTVMPFILRGVSLLGVSSTNCPLALRARIWHRLASDLKPKDLNVFVSRTLGFEDLIDGAWDMINRKTSGRTLVKIR